MELLKHNFDDLFLNTLNNDKFYALQIYNIINRYQRSKEFNLGHCDKMIVNLRTGSLV